MRKKKIFLNNIFFELKIKNQLSNSQVRTDYENAYVCQGTRIKNDRSLLRLLPRRGELYVMT